MESYLWYVSNVYLVFQFRTNLFFTAKERKDVHSDTLPGETGFRAAFDVLQRFAEAQHTRLHS